MIDLSSIPYTGLQRIATRLRDTMTGAPPEQAAVFAEALGEVEARIESEADHWRSIAAAKRAAA